MEIVTDADVQKLVNEVGRHMQASLPRITDAMGALLADGVAGINNDPDLTEMLYASIGGNLSTIADILVNDIPIERLHPTTAAVEYALRCAQRGVSGNALRRAYHVGQDDLMTSIFGVVQTLDCPPEQKVLVLHRSTQIINAYIDWITQFVLEIYDTEKERWLEASGNMSNALIHQLVSKQPVDVGEFQSETGYSLAQFHLAMVAWTVTDDPGQGDIMHMQECLRDVATKCGAAGEPLITAVDRSTVWAWMPLADRPQNFDIESIRDFAAKQPSCRVTLGLPAEGIDGFSRSHTQAQSARVLASAMDHHDSHALSYGDDGVAICSVLARDIAATRTWVQGVLGNLATNSDAHERLRETSRVFLSTGGRFSESAELLNLHRNSVKYRVTKAVEERGRPFHEDRLDVELALQVCHFLGPSVTTPPSG